MENELGSRKIKRRSQIFKPWLVDGAAFAGAFEMPSLDRCNLVPERAVPFDKALRTADTARWVHFFIEDSEFERVWSRPRAYLARLGRFNGVIAPDYSLYLDMPLAMQLWNTYRGRAIGYWLQRNGLSIIPNVRWSDERSYAFSFDGIPKHGTVAVSAVGCVRESAEREYFKRGMAEMLRRLEPETTVIYGGMPERVFGGFISAGLNYVNIPNYNVTVRKKAVA